MFLISTIIAVPGSAAASGGSGQPDIAAAAATTSIANPGAGAPAGGSQAPLPFSLASVAAGDNKTIDVTFSDRIGTDFQNFVVSVPNAFIRYVRISGGVTSQSDALLNGQFLTTARATAQVKATAAKDTLRIVFIGTGTNAITLVGGRSYDLWLDANNNPTTTTSAASAIGATNIRVASVLDLAVGQTIQVGTGGNAESRVVASVGTAGSTGTGVDLTTALGQSHASGNTVAVTAESRSLASLHFASAEAQPIIEVADHQTAAVTFSGISTAPQLAAIASATFVTSRVVRVTFNATILDGMAFHVYSAGRMTLASTGPSSSMTPRYVDVVPDTEKTQFDLYFPNDAPASAATYTLTVLANPNSTSNTTTLQTSAGRIASAATALTAGLAAPAVTHPQPAIGSVSVNDARTEITIGFPFKLDRFTLPGVTPTCSTPGGSPAACVNPLSAIESTNNIGGRVLTRDQLLQVFSFSGLTVEGGGDAVDWLRDSPGYMPDARTVVVTLRNGARLTRATSGQVTLLADRIVDRTLKTNPTQAAAVAVNVPDTDPPAPQWDPEAEEYLTVDQSSTVSFERYDYRFNPDERQLVTTVPDRTVDETLDAIVVDTKYLKVTFVPGFGGRLLSIVYKPTGKDLLYKNPVVVPYQINTTVFYNRWLAVWGGIFPTFSEPEHGKYWFDPWDYTVTQTADAVEVQLTRVDTLNYASRPSNYNNGATGLELTVTYTVRKSSPVVDMAVRIHNPSSTSRNYEYWTCTTLAPGVNAEGSVGSPTMQIVAPVANVTHDSAYAWMRSVDTQAPGGNASTLNFTNLSYMTNWMANGIAYGNGLNAGTQKGWWGVINHENDEGILRIATSQGGTQTVTPGMKLWEWGYESSFGTGDPNTLTSPSANSPASLGTHDVASPDGSNRYLKGDSPAPYIEIWPGVSNHFFTDATIAGNATVSFTDSYMPTMDLANVTNANANGAAYVKVQPNGANATVTADVWSTRIGRTLTARLVDTKTGNTVAQKTFVGNAYQSERLTATMAGNRSARLDLIEGPTTVLSAIQAIPASVPDDTIAPVTTASLAPAAVGGYYQDPTVTLTATDGSGSGVDITEYRVDGGPFITYAGPFQVTGEGSHTLNFRSRDYGGNLESLKTLTLAIDTIAPTTTATLDPPAVGGYYHDPTVTLSATDGAGSGVASTEYRIDGGPWTTYTVPFPVTGDGSHTLDYRSTDVAGNVEGADTIFLIDTTAPTTNPDPAPPPTNGWYHDPTITLTAADPAGSGVATTEYRLDGGPWTTYGAPFQVTGDGSHTLEFRSIDNAGNVETTVAFSFSIDTTAPITAASLAPPAIGGYYHDPTVTISAADGSGSGVASTEYRLDGGPWTTYGGPFIVTGDGSHSLDVRSTDVAGNVGIPGSTSFDIDTTAPTTTAAIEPPPISGYHSHPTVTLTGVDGTGSGVAVTEYRLDGGPWTAYGGPFAVASDGSHTLDYRSTDVAGNVETTQTTSFVVDSTAPSTSASLAPAPVGGYYTNPTVTLAASDGGSGVASTEYSLDGGPWTPYGGPFVVTGDGGHTLDYRSTDVAGNVEAAQTGSFDVDATAPTIDLVAPVAATTQVAGQPGNYPLNSTQLASYSCDDNLSGPTSCVGTVASGAAFDTSSVGFHSFSVTATDAAGHTTTTTIQYNVYWAAWSNFFQPVDVGALNVVNAGRAIPVKFSLGGDYGLGIFAAGYPKAQLVSCSTSLPEDTIEETVNAGGSSLSYGNGQYVYVWKTDSAWAGTCRQLQIKLTDNTVHTAMFRFKN